MDCDSIFFFLLLAWGLPLSVFRSRFRKMVYQTESWMINIQPFFWREIKTLFGLSPHTAKEELRLIAFYRFYLVVYLVLLGGVLYC
jgi:hypothetical protein